VLGTFAIVLATLCAHPAVAETTDVNQVINGVEAAYKDVQTLRADFVQITRSKAMGDETKQKGKVMLRRPRMMRWEFTQPAGNLFVTNGEKMWVWSAPENQVIISSGMGGGSNGMSQLLEDLNRLGDIFNVELLPEEGKNGSVLLGLKPKQDAGFQSLRLRLEEKTYLVQSVVMVDAFGNEVDLRFNQVRTNVAFNDSDFSFEVPKGAQVLNADGP
jgi:outer membrane lipoprotein carrier protein